PRLRRLACGREDPLRGAEVGEQGALARRPDARQLVEQRALHRAVAARAMVRESEAVGLVADPLQQLQLWRAMVERERRPAPGDEHLLDALRERHDGHAAIAEAAQ